MKFRVWHNDMKKFLKQSDVFINGFGEVYYHDIMDGDLVRANPDEVVFQRFSGYYDTNKKEIYEGDIIELNGKISGCVEMDEHGPFVRSATYRLDLYWVDRLITGNILEK